jgi:hypothetical protein
MRKNKNTLNLIASSYEAYKEYIDNPTSKNLRKFNLIAEQYKDAYIEDFQEYDKTSSADLINLVSGFRVSSSKKSDNKTINSLNELKSITKRDSLDHKDEVVLLRLQNLLDRQIQRNGGRPLNPLQILNRLIHHCSTRLGAFQNEPSIERLNALTKRPDELRKYKDKGPIRLFTKHVCVPKSFFDYFDIRNIQTLDYNEFGITKYNYHIKINEEDGSSKVREIPRRWYVEKNNVDDTKQQNTSSSAWLESRSDIQPLFESFQNLYGSLTDDYSLKSSDLEDSRISNQIQILSKSITLEERKKLLKEISLNDHEFRLFCNLSNLRFAVVDFNLLKTSRQMLQRDEGKVKWRDVCIFNADIFTIRSFTSDRSHIPIVSEYKNTNDWFLSNEMPKLSYQSMDFFAKVLEEDSHKSNKNNNNLTQDKDSSI